MTTTNPITPPADTKRAIPGREDFTVMTTAAELHDGTVIEGPKVYLDAPERGLTAAQARSLAGLLMDAAETLDGWNSEDLPNSETGPSWRAMSDRLTPEQSRHLAAVERLALDNAGNSGMRATAAETLASLPDEAAYYAHHNPTPGAMMAATIEGDTK